MNTADARHNAQHSASSRMALASLCLTMLLSSLGTSAANVALPAIAQAFGASLQEVQWIVLAYLLATTTLIVSAGRLGDTAGRRRLMLAGLAVFTASSALCGLAPQLPLLIAARATQGVGAAAMMALTMAFVGDAAPKDKAGSAMGLLGTISAVGTALGPSLGGVVVAAAGWRAIFFINLPLGLLALLFAFRHLPDDRPSLRTRQAGFDHRGTVLLGLTLAAYAMAMTWGRDRLGAANAALLCVAALGAGMFVLAERRARSPLVRLEMIRNPVLGAGFATSALVSTVVMSTLVVGPFYLTGALGLDAAQAGFAMSAGPIVSALTGVPAGRLVDRFGSHRASLAGLSIMAAGCALLPMMPASLGIPGYVIPLVTLTAGYATFQAANNTAIMADVGAEQRGLVSGMLNLARNLGLITGASLMGAAFALGSGDVVAGMRITFAVATALVVVALAATRAGRAQSFKMAG